MRLIDADALKKQIEDWYCAPKNFDNEIDRAPTVDAVLVVRCKDCKHRDPEDRKCDNGKGIIWNLPRPDDWFCADGERQEATR